MAIDVSVVIPCCNDGKYLAEAVASVELERHADVEIIIADDGSGDVQTLQILEKLSAQGIRIIHGDHAGPSGARNAAIFEARGRYILPLDADDRIESAYIPSAKALLDEDETLGVVYCHADLFGEESGAWALPDYSLEKMLIDNVVFITAMFRREDWERVGGFKADMRWGMEDYDFFLSLLELGRGIRQIPDVYFHYRIRKGSRTVCYKRDFEHVKQAYQRIYERHEALYRRYMDTYVQALREEVIRHRYNHQRLAEKARLLRRLLNNPLFKRIARRLTKIEM